MISLITGVFGLLALALWIWAIIDVAQHYKDDSGKTIVWLVIIVCFPLVGSLLYFWRRNRTFIKRRRFDPDFGETV